MLTTVIVTGSHTPETVRRLRELSGCRLVLAEKPGDIAPEDLAEAEIIAGHISPELLSKMPRLRFVQLFSAGANGYSWLPEKVTLANAYGAYGDSIAEHMLTTTLMAMKRMPEYLEMQGRQGWDLLKDIIRIEGSRILSVGMGAIGTSYLRKVSALGAVCFGVRPILYIFTTSTPFIPPFLPSLLPYRPPSMPPFRCLEPSRGDIIISIPHLILLPCLGIWDVSWHRCGSSLLWLLLQLRTCAVCWLPPTWCSILQALVLFVPYAMWCLAFSPFIM